MTRERAEIGVGFSLLGVLFVLAVGAFVYCDPLPRDAVLLALALAFLVILAYLARNEPKSLRVGNIRPTTNVEALVCRNVPEFLVIPLLATFFAAELFWIGVAEYVYINSIYGRAAWTSGLRMHEPGRLSNGVFLSEPEMILELVVPCALSGLTVIASWIGAACFVMKLRGERLADQLTLYRRTQHRMAGGLDVRSLVADRGATRASSRFRTKTVTFLLLLGLYAALSEVVLHSLELIWAVGILLGIAFASMVTIGYVERGASRWRRKFRQRGPTTNLQAMAERYLSGRAGAPFIINFFASMVFWPHFVAYAYVNLAYGREAWASGLRAVTVRSLTRLSNGEIPTTGAQILLGPVAFALGCIMTVVAPLVAAYLALKLRGERFRDQLAIYRQLHKAEVRDLRTLLRERLIDWTPVSGPLPNDCQVPPICPECGRAHAVSAWSTSVNGHRVVICDAQCPTCGTEHHSVLTLPEDLPSDSD